eukprot:gnl/MRDRNA2_/MRDRNA2_94167_c0_seq1.p1 gnl/MRDRNA2_/MRDRNA2_94167_c0~~gnl/MRDRNA2_/MRDRNA2_94167_c0_seq1.p1  ORF type:complete len:654 (+),score=167.23 gnl/MRDRNA2_/MRDRNA2_94167_c0_seq1:251-1963(+)
MADPFRETRKTNSTAGGTFGGAGWMAAEQPSAVSADARQKRASQPSEPKPQAPMRKAQDSGEAKVSGKKRETKKQAEKAGQFFDNYKKEQKKESAQPRKTRPVEQPLERYAHDVLYRDGAHVYAAPDEVSAPGTSPMTSARMSRAHDMPPRAPGKVNAPPPPGVPPGVRDSGAVDIRSSRALQEVDDSTGLPPVRPPSRNKVAPEPARVDDRQSYGGKFIGGKFFKNQISSVDELSKEDQQKIMQDLEQERRQKIEELAARQKQHEMRRRKQEMQERKKYHMQQSSSTPDLQQDGSDDGRNKKVLELKKWLQRKEDESRKKREAEQRAMKELLDREKQKMERKEQTEKARMAEREKRLKVADRRKAELEQQMVQGRPGVPGPSGPYPGSRAHGEQGAEDPGNVMHRHIHHHIHYHQEGDEEGEEGVPMHSSDEYESGDTPGDGPPSMPRNAANAISVDERRRIEQESEQTVRLQLPEGGMGQSFGGSSGADYYPERQAAPSIGGESSEMARTIESFAPHVNAALRRSHSESAMPRQAPGPRYAQSVQRATGAYADPGRPRYARGGQPAWS